MIPRWILFSGVAVALGVSAPARGGVGRGGTSAGGMQGTDAPQPLHLDARQREAVDRAIERACDWIRTRQREDGSFECSSSEVCPVAVGALALWALASASEREADLDAAARASRFLLLHAQPDGGVYDAARGLHVYTSGVAARALEAFAARRPSEEIDLAWRRAALFAYREGIPESAADESPEAGLGSAAGGEEARRILDSRADLSEEQRRALEFLARARGEGTPRALLRTRRPDWAPPDASIGDFTYEDVLPIVYRELSPEQQLALRARNAIRASYTLQRNPDLTRRFGPTGFQQGQQGIYYYYLLVTRTLSTFGSPVLELQSGERRDWVRELSARLLSLQLEDGRWENGADRWWESEPLVVTAYSVLALDLCREQPALPSAK